MIGGTVNRKPKQQSSIMVRAAVVAFVLLAGLVMVGAAGGATAGRAEDQDAPRSSVLMTVVEGGGKSPTLAGLSDGRGSVPFFRATSTILGGG